MTQTLKFRPTASYIDQQIDKTWEDIHTYLRHIILMKKGVAATDGTQQLTIPIARQHVRMLRDRLNKLKSRKTTTVPR